MSYARPKIDYSKKQFINEVMDKNHPDASNNNTYNINYIDDNLDEALKFYNIDEKYLKLHYGNKNSHYNIQVEIAQLLDFMLRNYKESLIFDKREGKSEITISDINSYNENLIESIVNSESLPYYVKALFQNNNTFRYNENFGELSKMLVDRLTYLFYLIFNVNCQGTEEIIINLIQQIDIWNKDIIKNYYNPSYSHDNMKQTASANKNNKSDKAEIHITGLNENTVNDKHSLDTNITMIFNSLIRNEVSQSNLLIHEGLRRHINESNTILQDLIPSDEIHKEIYEIFDYSNGKNSNELRTQYIKILNELTTGKIEFSNNCNNNKKYENDYIALNMELIKLFSEEKRGSEKARDIITDLIKQELLCYVGEFKKETNRNSFSHPYWRVLLQNINLKKYYARINAYIIKTKLYSKNNYHFNSEYKESEKAQIEYKQFTDLDKLLTKYSSEIYKEIINEAAKYDTFISDDKGYNSIKENMNLLLGQIYLQVLQNEHSEFIKYKNDQTNKSNKTKKSSTEKKPK